MCGACRKTDTHIRSKHHGNLLVAGVKLSRERGPYHVSLCPWKSSLACRAVNTVTSRFQPHSRAVSLPSAKGSSLGTQALTVNIPLAPNPGHLQTELDS